MDAPRLENFLKSGKTTNLGNLFEYLQGIAEGLESVVRWEKREQIAGQSVRETDLQHIFKTTFLTIICAVLENNWRRTYGLLPHGKDQLDIGLLVTMALVHDIGEIITGDTAHFEKIKLGGVPQEEEMDAFQTIISPLPPVVQEYFIQAFRHTMFNSDQLIENMESKFFDAIEHLGSFKRALHECRLRNLHFAPKCLLQDIDILEKYSFSEFASLKYWYSPFIDEANRYSKEFERRREEYISEFISNGGKEEDFPF